MQHSARSHQGSPDTRSSVDLPNWCRREPYHAHEGILSAMRVRRAQSGKIRVCRTGRLIQSHRPTIRDYGRQCRRDDQTRGESQAEGVTASLVSCVSVWVRCVCAIMAIISDSMTPKCVRHHGDCRDVILKLCLVTIAPSACV